MKRLLLLSGVLFFTGTVWSALTTAAPGPTRMLRQPTVSADRVAFTYASNIWVVERAGGIGQRRSRGVHVREQHLGR
jgi:hypothetical protein